MQAGAWLDIAIILVLCTALIKGYFQGFLRQTAALVGIALGIFVALSRFKIFAEYLMDKFTLSATISQIIAFALIVLAVSAVINLIGLLLQKFTKLVLLSLIDNLGGAGLGLVKGSLIVYLALLLVSRIPYGAVNQYIESSFLASKFLELTPVIQENLDRILHL